MRERTLEEHRARIQNINAAEKEVKRCFRRSRVRDYIPGQVTYYLGDYPARFSTEPTEYDFNMLKDLAENGVGLVQLHEDWNDAAGLYGADKYSSTDPEGLRHFVNLCHYFGLKVIPYISSGYFHVFHPDFDEDFLQTDRWCQFGMHFKYRRCSAGSARWRSYILPKTFEVLDKYGFDGVYNDSGLDSSTILRPDRLSRPGLSYYDPEIEDLLCLMYSEVKRRGGVYKFHSDTGVLGGLSPAPCVDKMYDYLWVGEMVKDAPIGAGKDYPNYVVPCPDFARSVAGSLEFHFLKAIPFLQFPLLMRGRHNMGTHLFQNVPYYGEEIPDTDPEFLRRVHAYMQEHPNGPYVYSFWSSLGHDDEYYELWKKYMRLYKPMVQEESVAYIELRQYDGILSQLPEQVFASLYVNEETYLVVTNFTGAPYTLELKDAWENRETGKREKTYVILPEGAVFLKK